MTATDLARRMEHTILVPDALSRDVHRVASEAVDRNVAACCVAPVWVGRVATMLRGSGVRVCTVAGFPHGTSKATLKAIEGTSAVKDGADEVDVVAHLPHLIAADVDAARAELIEIVKAVRAARRDVVVKVIVESALLMRDGADLGEQRIAAACRAIREGGCDYVKTSTGFHPAGGATADAVLLLRKHAAGLLVKAAGGIRTLADARAMLNAGADRIGCSATVAILTEAAARGTADECG